MRSVDSDLIQTLAEALLLAGGAFLMTLIGGRWWVRWLRAKKIGKEIREDLPADHQVKAGTPTMGGAMIVVSVVILTAIFNLFPERLSMLLPLATLISFGILGAFDDFLTLTGTKSNSYGVTARFKFVWLVLIALIASLALYLPREYGGLANEGEVVIPFYGVRNIGLWYIPIATFLIVAMANAVNLTDGMDGLAGWNLTISFATYGVLAFLGGFDFLVVYSFTVAGACAAFLWYNAHPAQVFMGDMGALALGATLAIIALQSQRWLLLPVVGVVFLVETLSVMIQVLYFKWTKRRTGEGKRIFKMSPLHFHFRLLGWSEMQVVQRFVLISVIAAMVGISLALTTPTRPATVPPGPTPTPVLPVGDVGG